MARIGIIGIAGRMGQALVSAIERAGHECAGGADRGDDVGRLADGSDALVDFSAPGALKSNLHAAIACPMRPSLPMIPMRAMPFRSRADLVEAPSFLLASGKSKGRT